METAPAGGRCLWLSDGHLSARASRLKDNPREGAADATGMEKQTAVQRTPCLLGIAREQIAAPSQHAGFPISAAGRTPTTSRADSSSVRHLLEDRRPQAACR